MTTSCNALVLIVAQSPGIYKTKKENDKDSCDYISRHAPEHAEEHILKDP